MDLSVQKETKKVTKLPAEHELYSSRLLRLIDLLEMAVRRFYRDGLTKRANAIAYSLLISIIPLLTIATRFTNLNREDLRLQIVAFFQLYGITGADPIVNALDDILGRSNAIAGIGLLIMVYAATSIFSYLEETANHIFRVRPRPWLIRNAIFTSWLVIAPFIIVISISFLSKVQREYELPVIHSLVVQSDTIYTLDSHHRINIQKKSTEPGKTTFETKRSIDYLSKVDFSVIGRNLSPENETTDGSLTMTQSWADNVGQPISLLVYNDHLYVVARPNFLFYSLDAGQSWDFRVLQSSYDRGATIPRIVASRIESNRLFLLINSPRGSRLLLIHPERMEILANIGFNHLYRSFTMLQTSSPDYLLTGSGRLRESQNGYQWNEASSLPSTIQSLTDIIDRPEKGGWLTLQDTGRVSILTSERSVSYPALHLPLNSFVKGIVKSDSGYIFAFTKAGDIRVSLDEGDTWIKVITDTAVSGLATVFDADESGFMIATDQGSLYRYKIDRIRLEKPGDIPVLQALLTDMTIPSQWRPMFGHVVVNLFAFVALQILFGLSYRLLPNAHVSKRAAWLGAITTSIITLLFTVVFRRIIPLFATTGVIYGIWVALPLGLMVLLLLVQVFLFGLEVTRLLDSPRLIRHGIISLSLYRFSKKSKSLMAK